MLAVDALPNISLGLKLSLLCLEPSHLSLDHLENAILSHNLQELLKSLRRSNFKCLRGGKDLLGFFEARIRQLDGEHRGLHVVGGDRSVEFLALAAHIGGLLQLAHKGTKEILRYKDFRYESCKQARRKMD